MSKKTYSLDEIYAIVEHLSPREMQKLNTHFAQSKKLQKTDSRIENMVLLDLQERVKSLGINNVCPKCGSKIIYKKGQRNGIQRLQCKECKTYFTYFTGTFLEKTKYHWDFWVEFIYLMLSDTSIEKIKSIMETDLHCLGIGHETIYYWRQKILEASKKVPLPKLVGTVEVDETYVHEGQKGSLKLVDPLNNDNIRTARKTRKSSKYGIMGPEFGNIICAVDATGHSIAKYVGVGSCTEKTFEDLFHPYICDASWICTDANGIYRLYTSKYGMNHYVRPSTYLDTLYQGKKNDKTEEFLYEEEMLDYIDLCGRVRYPFDVFTKIKSDNKLSLAHVNEFHNEIKALIKNTHGISLINLDGYMAWKTMLRNYKVDHGHPAATKKDAEEILILLLKTKTNIKIEDLKTKKPDFSSLNKDYKDKLISMTDDIRKRNGKEKFKLNPDKLNINLNKREFLDSLPIYMLKFLCDKCNIKGKTKMKKGFTYKFIKELEKSEDLDKAIVDLFEMYG